MYLLQKLLGSYFDMAMALFREIIVDGPYAYKGIEGTFRLSHQRPSKELSHIYDVACLLAKIELFHSFGADEYNAENRFLTSAAREASACSLRCVYPSEGKNIDSHDKYTFMYEIAPLLYDPHLRDLDVVASDEAERRLVTAGFNYIAEDSNYIAEDSLNRHHFGLLLLVLAAVRAIKAGRTDPNQAAYPPQQVQVFSHEPVLNAEDLKDEVYGMARAILARVPSQSEKQ